LPLDATKGFWQYSGMDKETSVKIPRTWYEKIAAQAKKEGRTIKGQLAKIFEGHFNGAQKP